MYRFDIFQSGDDDEHPAQFYLLAAQLTAFWHTVDVGYAGSKQRSPRLERHPSDHATLYGIQPLAPLGGY